MERNYKMDNIKAFLIFLVVLGHLLELVPGQKSEWLYYVIYTFHMPAFVYITGYFSRPDSGKRFFTIVYTYILYQIFYLIFQRYGLGLEVPIQFTYPYWLLWYLVSMSSWQLILPIVQTGSWDSCLKEPNQIKKQKIIIGASAAIALLAGYDQGVNYYLSLSRTLCLLPFFLMGHYRVFDRLQDRKRRKPWLMGGCLFWIVAVFFAVWLMMDQMEPRWFYHSYPYDDNYSLWIRAVILSGGVIWISALHIFITEKPIWLISTLGKYTLPVFLLHGFLIKWMEYHPQILALQRRHFITAAFLAGGICLLLGNRIVYRMVNVTLSIPFCCRKKHVHS